MCKVYLNKVNFEEFLSKSQTRWRKPSYLLKCEARPPPHPPTVSQTKAGGDSLTPKPTTALPVTSHSTYAACPKGPQKLPSAFCQDKCRVLSLVKRRNNKRQLLFLSLRPRQQETVLQSLAAIQCAKRFPGRGDEATGLSSVRPGVCLSLVFC